ncbi:CMRF35-like molecule 8 isoform X3 [Alosa pseudoharengus]|uniref:CMRF35-like molecule 8 isoform X3 n=1 Tax=Alosa pseudoharengus TaxID=34774 RepID=UPI003F8884CA
MQTYILLICGLLIGVNPVKTAIMVTGHVGGSAVIRCPYDQGYERYSKYLCTGKCSTYGHRNILVWTIEGQTTAVSGRFLVHDNNTARVFTVNIHELTVNDSGKYWCGVDRSFLRGDLYNDVDLKVVKDVSSVVTPTTDANQTTEMTMTPDPISIYEASTIPLTTETTKNPEPISSRELSWRGTLACSGPQADGHTASEPDGVYANVGSTKKQQDSIYQNINLGPKSVHFPQDT